MRQWIVRDSAAILTCSADYHWRALAAEALVDQTSVYYRLLTRCKHINQFTQENCQKAGAVSCTPVA